MSEPPRPRLGRPTSDESAALRQKVLDHAVEMLCRVGDERMVVDKLAEQAGVTKRTIYRQFGNKNGLIAAVIERMLDWVLAMDSVPSPVMEDPVDALRNWAKRFYDTSLLPDIAMFLNYISFESATNQELIFKQRLWHGRIIDTVSHVIAAAQQQGLLGVGSPSRIALLLVDLLYGPSTRSRFGLLPDQVYGQQDRDEFFEDRWGVFLVLTRAGPTNGG